MSEQDGGPPGIALEQARVIRPDHEADHDRHQEVLARLDAVIALLERLLQAAEGSRPRSAPRGPSRAGK
jgi:hypothetical protein